jgi:hypothetical protein
MPGARPVAFREKATKTTLVTWHLDDKFQQGEML